MCIYCNTSKYRQIYENHYGPIPVDVSGRTFDIHHVDGNRKNNHPDNLVALSIQDHYDLHLKQEDWDACYAILIRMSATHEQLASMSQKAQLDRVRNKTHHFLDPVFKKANSQRLKELASKSEHPFQTNKVRNKTKQRIAQQFEDGNHPFQKLDLSAQGTKSNLKRLENSTHPFKRPGLSANINKQRVTSGTHNFLGGQLQRDRVADGTHNFLIKVECPYCSKIGSKNNMMRYHFDKCPQKV